MLRLMSYLAMALIVEMVFFGPLGLSLAGVPIRKVLIGGLVLSSLIPMFFQRAPGAWQIVLLISIVLFLLTWGFIVPLANGIDMSMAVAEIQPFVALFLVFPFYFLFRAFGAEPYLRTLRLSVAAMAAAVIVVWICTNVLGLTGVGLSARTFYIGLNDSEIGVYIGPMPDGSFRVMLINFVLFPIMIAYYNWNRINLPWSLYYVIASFATGTRAFVGVAVLIIGLTLLRKRPILAIPIIVGTAALLMVYVISGSQLRIFDFASDLTSSSARYIQFFSLMNLFAQYPVFGAGFGASASVIRSFEAPYSYEMTYVALFAKLGIVGSLIVAGAFTFWITGLMRRSMNYVNVLGLVLAVFLMTATNPYLINLIGMGIVAFLIALGVWAKQVTDEPLLPPDRHGEGTWP